MKTIIKLLIIIILAYSFTVKIKESEKLFTMRTTEPGAGTTRSHEFQRAYEEAVKEYDRNHSGLPSGLVLPSGETVQEYINSGRSNGK